MSSSTSNILDTKRNHSLTLKKLADIYNRELLAIIGIYFHLLLFSFCVLDLNKKKL